MNEQQLAKIVTLTSQLLQEKDIHSKYNIVGDKTIYAKEGLYVGDFNPAYDFFIKGRGCVTGDLVVKGNLFYENNGNKLESSFCDVSLKLNKPAGFRIRDDVQSKGLMWDNKEEEFIIGDEKYFDNKNLSNLLNIKLKNINCMNNYCKNILIESTIISTHNTNNINIEGNLIIKGDIKIDGIISSPLESIIIKNPIITKSIKMNGDLNTEGNIQSLKKISSQEIESNSIQSQEIISNNISIIGETVLNNNTEIRGHLITKKSAEFNSTVEIKNNLYLGKSLIFTNENSGIAFSKLTNIENASVNFINGKKISNHDLINTEDFQSLSNKSLGNNLDAKYNKIINIDNPTDQHDAVNKKYVDQYITGGHLLEPCRLTTSEKLDAAFMASSYQLISKKMENLIVDKVEVNIGDRILVKNQTLTVENGIYIVVAKGNKNQQWILQLADDCVEIVRNRPRIVPIVFVRFGEIGGRRLYGINMVTQRIWDFMGVEDFVNINLLDKIEELGRKMEKLETYRR